MTSKEIFRSVLVAAVIIVVAVEVVGMGVEVEVEMEWVSRENKPLTAKSSEKDLLPDFSDLDVMSERCPPKVNRDPTGRSSQAW